MLPPAAVNFLSQPDARTQVQEKAPWVEAILYMHLVLPDDLDVPDSARLSKRLYLEISNPAGVKTFLDELGRSSEFAGVGLAYQA